MFRKSWLLGLTWVAPLLAHAAVINFEFKFTPYTGDAKEDQVTTVAGTARVFLNKVPLAEQQISAMQVPVVFAGEVAPAVWLPVATAGPRLRKGTNHLRIEFQPTDAKAAYHAQLHWAEVNDQAAADGSTNQSGEGTDQREAKGALVMERDFTADFAADLPWHHYPAVTALGADDKSALLALLQARAQAFQPKFDRIYAALDGVEGVNVAEMRKLGCLDKAYAEGMRVGAPAMDQVGFVLTGQPEVLLQGKGDSLFVVDMAVLRKKITDPHAQECAGLLLGTVYGPRLAAVRDPAGGWKIVY